MILSHFWSNNYMLFLRNAHAAQALKWKHEVAKTVWLQVNLAQQMPISCSSWPPSVSFHVAVKIKGWIKRWCIWVNIFLVNRNTKTSAVAGRASSLWCGGELLKWKHEMSFVFLLIFLLGFYSSLSMHLIKNNTTFWSAQMWGSNSTLFNASYKSNCSPNNEGPEP